MASETCRRLLHQNKFVPLFLESGNIFSPKLNIHLECKGFRVFLFLLVYCLFVLNEASVGSELQLAPKSISTAR